MDPGPLGDANVGALASGTRNDSAGVPRPCRAPGGDPAPAIWNFRDYNYQFRDSCRAQDLGECNHGKYLKKLWCDFNKSMNQVIDSGYGHFVTRTVRYGQFVTDNSLHDNSLHGHFITRTLRYTDISK